jgi:hypothetical protein
MRGIAVQLQAWAVGGGEVGVWLGVWEWENEEEEGDEVLV